MDDMIPEESKFVESNPNPEVSEIEPISDGTRKYTTLIDLTYDDDDDFLPKSADMMENIPEESEISDEFFGSTSLLTDSRKLDTQSENTPETHDAMTIGTENLINYLIQMLKVKDIGATSENESANLTDEKSLLQPSISDSLKENFSCYSNTLSDKEMLASPDTDFNVSYDNNIRLTLCKVESESLFESGIGVDIETRNMDTQTFLRAPKFVYVGNFEPEITQSDLINEMDDDAQFLSWLEPFQNGSHKEATSTANKVSHEILNDDTQLATRTSNLEDPLILNINQRVFPGDKDAKCSTETSKVIEVIGEISPSDKNSLQDDGGDNLFTILSLIDQSEIIQKNFGMKDEEVEWQQTDDLDDSTSTSNEQIPLAKTIIKDCESQHVLEVIENGTDPVMIQDIRQKEQMTENHNVDNEVGCQFMSSDNDCERQISNRLMLNTAIETESGNTESSVQTMLSLQEFQLGIKAINC